MHTTQDTGRNAEVHTDHHWMRGWEFDKHVEPAEKMRQTLQRFTAWAGQECKFYQCNTADAIALGAPLADERGFTHVVIDGVEVIGARYVAPTVGYCGIDRPFS